MDAEIFLTPTFHMVKVKKCNGDTLEYQKLVKEDLRPDLADIVFVWYSNKDDELVPASHQETVSELFLTTT
ncbi:hypothetical protein Bca4012_070828 [Brassica carinata]|uniref:Uncharacterized protein n=1 Tax=Brassica carinata TaxID=52824 RepID=A0A8X7NZR8_BRACI|nr:hypothetical protein Bca52824_096558 [Brassica carinata]